MSSQGAKTRRGGQRDRNRILWQTGGWDGRVHPMRVLGSSGVWEIFLPGVGPGARYKYEVVSQGGHQSLRADPFALAAEVPPATASIVTRSTHEWQDAEWIAERTPAHRRVRIPPARPCLPARASPWHYCCCSPGAFLFVSSNTTNHEAPGPFPGSASQPCRPGTTTLHYHRNWWSSCRTCGTPRGCLTGIHLGLRHPFTQRLRAQPQSRLDRAHRRPLRVIVPAVLTRQPHRMPVRAHMTRIRSWVGRICHCW